MVRSIVHLPNLPNLYKITEADYERTNFALARAFEKDPIWSRILETSPDRYPYVFSVPLKYVLYYGVGYAPSDEIQGAALWVGTPYTDMTVLRLIRSQSLLLGMKIGLKTGLKINHAFHKMEKDRRTFMKGRNYVYLITLGIHPDYQRQGHGFNLVKSMLDALSNKVPVYLETATEGNVKFYEKLGFEVLKKITISLDELPMWELLFKK